MRVIVVIVSGFSKVVNVLVGFISLLMSTKNKFRKLFALFCVATCLTLLSVKETLGISFLPVQESILQDDVAENYASLIPGSSCGGHAGKIPGVIVSIPKDPTNNINPIDSYGPNSKGNDFTSRSDGNGETFLGLSSRDTGEVDGFRGDSDEDLEGYLRRGIAPGGDIGRLMVDLFMNWNNRPVGANFSGVTKQSETKTGVEAQTLRHGKDSALVKRISSHSQFSRGRDQVIQKVKRQIEAMALSQEDIDYTSICLQQSEFPSLDFYDDTDRVLAYTIGGIQGRAAFIRDFNIATDKSGYSGTLEFAYYDDFGVDSTDFDFWDGADWASSAYRGILAMWVLQHERDAKPFIQEMLIEVPFSGTFPVKDVRSGEQTKARNFGDPHLFTFDGYRYSFQLAGEFILSKSDDQLFEIQVRQSPISSSLSVDTALAMSMGTDRVGLYADQLPDDDMSTPLRINGVPIIVDRELSLRGGGKIDRNGSNYVFEWPTGEKLVAQINDSDSGPFINITAYVFRSQGGHVTGLLGNANGDVNDELRSRNGSQVLTQQGYGDLESLIGRALPTRSVLRSGVNLYLERLSEDYGNDWRVSQAESLFDYANGQSTETFTLEDFPSEYLALEQLSSTEIRDARNTCIERGVDPELMEGCVFDVAFSGRSEFARAAARVSQVTDVLREFGIDIPGAEILPDIPGGIKIPGLPF